jgi:hypothetical protein
MLQQNRNAKKYSVMCFVNVLRIAYAHRGEMHICAFHLDFHENRCRSGLHTTTFLIKHKTNVDSHPQF